MEFIFDGDVDSDTCSATYALANGIPADGILSTGVGAAVIIDFTSSGPLPAFGTIEVQLGFNTDVVPGTGPY